MIKKIILSLIVLILIVIGIKYYNSRKTVECWWGVAYPTLSFIAFEDEENTSKQISSTDENFMYVQKEEPIKVKIAILEWFKKIF